MGYISAPEYSKKFKIPINAVRTLANLENSPFKVKFSGQHVYIEDKKVNLITVIEYAEKYGFAEQRVREMSKAKEPPFQVFFVGVKAYILDNEEAVEDKKIEEVAKELQLVKEMMNVMCKHFGVNVSDIVLQ